MIAPPRTIKLIVCRSLQHHANGLLVALVNADKLWLMKLKNAMISKQQEYHTIV
jgi:hypothetical protein